MKGALACYVEALRALADAGVCLRGDVLARGCLRRDREDAVWRRPGGRVPRLCRRFALPRGARRRRGHVHPRRADGVEGRPRALRLALAAHLHEGPVHPHGVQRGEARRELDRAHARRARCRASRPGSRRMGGTIPANAYRGARAIVNVGGLQSGFGWRASRSAASGRPRSSTSACPRRRAMTARAQRRCSTWIRAPRSERCSPHHGIEGEVYVTAPGAEIAEDHPLVGRRRRRPRERSTERPPEPGREHAGSPTRRS